jgi:hypothetical protein
MLSLFLQRHGVGTHIQFGNKYIGEWKHNKRSGQGTMYYVTNCVYKGSWLDDLPRTNSPEEKKKLAQYTNTL